MDPQRALGGRLVGHLFALRFSMFFLNLGTPQTRKRRHGALPTGVMKKHHFDTKMSETLMGKRYFGKTAFS